MSEFSDPRGHVPPGETILWKGRPNWWALAVSAFHVRKVALYFVLLAAGGLALSAANGEGLVSSPLWIPAAIALSLLCGMAWLTARTTHYVITNRRVLMHFGVALPITLNIPLRLISSAGLKVYRTGAGDLPLATTGSDQLAYVVLWPHARPWQLRQTQPMLRALDAPHAVAKVLSAALIAAHAERPAQAATPTEVTASPAPGFVTAAA